MARRYTRRRTTRSRAKKSFNISAIEAGAALSLATSTGFTTAVSGVLDGSKTLAGGLGEISNAVGQNKQKIIGTLGAAFVAKMIAKGFGNQTLAKLGPIRVKS
jgi:hypothetical protein